MDFMVSCCYQSMVWIFDGVGIQNIASSGIWISFLMLLLCIYILREVKQRIESALSNTKMNGSKKMSRNLADGMKRIRNLMICEIILVFVFAVSVIYEIYVMISIAGGHLVTNVYAESTLMSLIAYFPVWTTIHIVLGVYTWISSDSLHYETRKKTEKEVNNV